MRRLLVTGARGLCGRAIAHAARQTGEWEVITTSRTAAGPGHIVHDLAEPLSIGGDAFPAEVDAIVHAAAVVDQAQPGFDVVAANTRAAFHVAGYAAASNCRQLVHLSSVSVYGAPRLGNTITEASAARPDSPYGLSKLLAEVALEHWGPRLDSLAHLRLGYVAGDGMSESTLVRRLARARAAGGPITLINPSRTRIQFLDADDLATVCLKALDASLSGVMLVAGAAQLSVEEIWREIEQMIPGHNEVDRRDDPAVAYDTRYKASVPASLGTGPALDFRITLRKAVDDLTSAAG